MEKKSKLRLYRKLKTRLEIEDYVVELDREEKTANNAKRRYE